MHVGVRIYLLLFDCMHPFTLVINVPKSIRLASKNSLIQFEGVNSYFLFCSEGHYY